MKGLAYGIFVFLNIDTDVVKILMILMAIDTLAGMCKAGVLKVKISLSVLFWGLMTKLLVLLIPMTLALVGKALKMGDFTPMVAVVLRIVVVAEALSIFTNFYSIRIRKPVENLDIITLLLSSIRKWMLKLIQSLLAKVDAPGGIVTEVEPEKIEDENK